MGPVGKTAIIFAGGIVAAVVLAPLISRLPGVDLEDGETSTAELAYGCLLAGGAGYAVTRSWKVAAGCAAARALSGFVPEDVFLGNIGPAVVQVGGTYLAVKHLAK